MFQESKIVNNTLKYESINRKTNAMAIFQQPIGRQTCKQYDYWLGQEDQTQR